MSGRRLWIGLAVGAVGLGSLLWARSKDTAQSSSATSGEKAAPNSSDGAAKTGWTRAHRLATQLDHPKGVVVDGEFAYVVTGGFAQAINAVLRISVTSGAVETLVKVPQILSGELAIDDKYVYFSSEADNRIFRVSRIGGPAVTVCETIRPIHLAVDETHVYFASLKSETADGAVLKISKLGGQPQVLVAGQTGVDQLAVDRDALYFRSNSGLWRVGKQGGAADCLLPAARGKNVDHLVADETHLYFFWETSGNGKYRVARMPKRGGAPEAIGPIANPTGRLALSDSHVYFFRAADLTDDALAKVEKQGSEPALVDGSGYSTGYLTVSLGDVYFTDVNSLYRVPK